MSEARRVLGRGAVCPLLKVLHRAGRLALLPTRIDSVGADYVVLKRALPYAVELTWNPELYDLSSKLVQESGYEDFTVQFKWGACGEGAGGSALHPRATSRPPASSADTYTGQQEAKGYNAFQVDTCRNCWIRRVRMVNCDNAVYVLNSDSCTVRRAAGRQPGSGWVGWGGAQAPASRTCCSRQRLHTLRPAGQSTSCRALPLLTPPPASRSDIHVGVTAPRGGPNVVGLEGHHVLNSYASQDLLFTRWVGGWVGGSLGLPRARACVRPPAPSTQHTHTPVPLCVLAASGLRPPGTLT